VREVTIGRTASSQLATAVVLATIVSVLQWRGEVFNYQDPVTRLVRNIGASRGATPEIQSTAGDATVPQISLQELERSYAHSDLIDVRPKIIYAFGHIGDAKNIPMDELEQHAADLEKVLSRAQGDSVIIYCADDECPDAMTFANALIESGGKNVFVLRGGWAAWKIRNHAELNKK
jgi:rhodanese-related sulfurtransferase